MKKILIVEDDQIVANIYRNKFTVEGFQVEIALDGEAGLKVARQFKPDAVILDLMLPKITGVELMKRLRAEAEFAQLPIIVFSNTYLTNLVQEAWQAGATKCLSKANCTPKQVLESVRSSLARSGATSTASAPATGSLAPAALPPAPAAAPQADIADGHPSDEEFQADLLRTFMAGLPATLTALRATLQGLGKAPDEPARLVLTQELYRRIHALTGNSAIVGLQELARMSDALEALLKELCEKPKNMNASTLRTVASAVDFLGVLFDKATQPGQEAATPASVLVVDDEAISRRAVTFALDKAKLKSVSVEDPMAALEMLAAKKYDLVFLDVDMPGMNGFELCTKLRNLPAHKTTPVVFVTSLNDFDSRASSMMSGGNDFIGKPFLFMELAVKALVHLLRGKFAPPR